MVWGFRERGTCQQIVSNNNQYASGTGEVQCKRVCRRRERNRTSILIINHPFRISHQQLQSRQSEARQSAPEGEFVPWISIDVQQPPRCLFAGSDISHFTAVSDLQTIVRLRSRVGLFIQGLRADEHYCLAPASTMVEEMGVTLIRMVQKARILEACC